jgi:hypothetical protein
MAEEKAIVPDQSARSAGRPPSGADARAEGRGDLTVEQILAWADAHHAAHGAWPAVSPGSLAGEVPGAPGETWKSINVALAMGLRGLPGDSSLAELLAEHRGVPMPDMSPQALAEKIWAWEQQQFPLKRPKLNKAEAPLWELRLTVELILAWADAHHAATGNWPEKNSGAVRNAPFRITWAEIDKALRLGRFGMPGCSCMSDLLAEYRPVPAADAPEPLSVEQILAWADSHHAFTGRWPTVRSGQVRAVPHPLKWVTIDVALRAGLRGVPAGSTLRTLLGEHRPPGSGPKRV